MTTEGKIKEEKLKCTITPSNAIDTKLTWTSSNEDVATVTQDGLIKAKTIGETTITVTTENGKQKSCKIKVIKGIYDITFYKIKSYDSNEYSFNVIEQKQIYYGDKIVFPEIEKHGYKTNEWYTDFFAQTGSYTGKISETTLITQDTIVYLKEENKVRVKGIKFRKKYITQQYYENAYEYGTNKRWMSVGIEAIFKPYEVYNSRFKILSSNEKVIKSTGWLEAPNSNDNTYWGWDIGNVERHSHISRDMKVLGLGKTKLTIISEDGNYKDTMIVNIISQQSNPENLYSFENGKIIVDSNTTIGKFYQKHTINHWDEEKIYDLNNKEINDENIILKTGMKIKLYDGYYKKTTEFKIIVKEKLSYSVHVQNIGWQENKTGGQIAGTSGKSLRLEGIKINLPDSLKNMGSITYSTHIQNIGWQEEKVNGSLSGTTGKSLRLEAIKIKLTNGLEKYYDIYYRVHAQNFGWMGWAKNGEPAGTAGYSYRLEAIQILLVDKGGNAPEGPTGGFSNNQKVTYITHVQNLGWTSKCDNGLESGTTGISYRLEGIKINLENKLYSGGITYSTHIQNIGWQGYKSDGEISGTTGRGLRLEAIKIKLTGEMAKKYDIYYRVHSQNFGWMGWAKNGEAAGTAGYSYRLEAIQILLIEKGKNAPGSTKNQYKQK